MGGTMNVMQEMLTIFTLAQESAACHQKNSLKLKKIYQKSNFNQFWEALAPTVHLILTVDLKGKNPFVDRVIDFVGMFCAVLNRRNIDQEENVEGEPLVTKLFGYLLEASNCIVDTIRFRACQMINKILDHLVGTELGDDLYEPMQEVLMERLSDSKSVIRLQAIVALYRLQDPTDPDDILIDKFIELMHDNRAKVRMLCVEKIACRRDVINFIVKRTRDVDVTVRLAAFKKLSKNVKSLKIRDRRDVLFTGIYDSQEKVKKCIFTEFLTCWWESYNNNILHLMKSLRLDADEKDVELTTILYEHVLNSFYFKGRTLKELLDVLPLTEKKLLPFEELNWETINYWRLLIILFSANSDLENHLEMIVPEVVFFCRYVKEYLSFNANDTDETYFEKQYIIKQLFFIIRSYDLSDNHSVQTVRMLVDYVLKKGDLLPDTIETIIGTLEKTSMDAERRCLFGMEIISDILCPINVEEEQRIAQEKEFQLCQLKVQLATFQNDQEQAIAISDYIEAERLKHLIENTSFQINEMKNKQEVEVKKKTDISTTCKCLDIAWAVLRCANVTKLTSSLKSLKDDYLPELLVHPNEIVRLKALKCYSICCVYDKPTAQQGIHIFAVPILAYHAGEECDIQTLMTCIATVSDLLRIYGSGLTAEPNEDDLSESVNEEHQQVFAGGTSLTSLIQGLVDLMEDEQYEVQLKACEGLCKLVLSERIHSSSLVSRLILKWCHPINDDEIECQTIKQFVGHVLEKLPHLPSSTDQLEGAILLTLNTLASAPKTSPLATVDIDNIAKFMLALCKLSHKSETLQCNIALSLCKKMSMDPTNKLNTIYLKILLMIELPNERNVLEEMFALIDEVREYISEKTALRNATKFLSILDDFIRGNCDMSVIEEAGENNVAEEEDEEEDNIDE